MSAQQHCRPMSLLKTNRRPKNSPKKRRRLRSRNLSRSRSSLKYSDCPRTPAPRRVPSSRIRAQRPRPYSSEQQSRNRRVATRSALPAIAAPQGRMARPRLLPKSDRPMRRSLLPGHSRLRPQRDRRPQRKGHAHPLAAHQGRALVRDRRQPTGAQEDSALPETERRRRTRQCPLPQARAKT